MGCDGGTIPRRDELVRLKKKPEQKDKDSEREFRWLHCAITQQSLQEPIVMCGLGRLYSKQSIIEQLLEKEKMPESIKHIKSLKDVKQLTLTPNPAFNDSDAKASKHAPYICKLIGLEMSGKFRFIALWSCGCVMSERALKEIGGSATNGNCPVCQQPYCIEDVIILNAVDEDLEHMQIKITMRSNKRKANKKDKKRQTVTQTTAAVASTSDCQVVDDYELHKSNEKGKIQVGSAFKCSASTSANALKLVANPKRSAASSDVLKDPELKRLKTDYSVAKDPKASDVYKSLFTSHHSEREQNRAHWITYNPFYN